MCLRSQQAKGSMVVRPSMLGAGRATSVMIGYIGRRKKKLLSILGDIGYRAGEGVEGPLVRIGASEAETILRGW